MKIVSQQTLPDEATLTPPEVVRELSRYIISQDDAKRAVAVALRNRFRRLRVPAEFREEITPKNIIMIGPTGVGKTEIARRLAKMVRAPFVKVEASKFTEVGYVGRDVESIIRDLAETSFSMAKEEERKRVEPKAQEIVEEKILNLLLPAGRASQAAESHEEPESSTRSKLREMLASGALDDRLVEVDVPKNSGPQLEILGPPGFAEVEGQIKDMLVNMLPKARERKRVTVAEARRLLVAEAQEGLVDHETLARTAIERAEQSGIVFIDEIDKICGPQSASKGPDVSREGVQRDLLPIVEGSTVTTKYGPVRTDHILFIASGAFHFSKPSDLMPEFQGRFPIRVELRSLTADDFIRILTEPKNALTRQYSALLATEGVTLEFSEGGIRELARLTAEVNSKTEDIGARRLHTLLEKVLEDLSFQAHDYQGKSVLVDDAYVLNKLSEVVKDQDLSRFIL